MGCAASGRRGARAAADDERGSLKGSPAGELRCYHRARHRPVPAGRSVGYHDRRMGWEEAAMEESPSFAEPYLSNLAVELRKLKSLADRAVAQVRDDDRFAALDPESNSLAILLQHLSGSL